MAEHNLAKYLAEVDEGLVRDGWLWISGESFLIEEPSKSVRENMEQALKVNKDYLKRITYRHELLEAWLKNGAKLKEKQ